VAGSPFNQFAAAGADSTSTARNTTAKVAPSVKASTKLLPRFRTISRHCCRAVLRQAHNGGAGQEFWGCRSCGIWWGRVLLAGGGSGVRSGWAAWRLRGKPWQFGRLLEFVQLYRLLHSCKSGMAGRV